MMTENLIMENLSHHSGTINWYKHISENLYTDGIKDMAEMCQSYWLIDLLMFTVQEMKSNSIICRFVSFDVVVKLNQMIIYITDGNKNKIYEPIEIPYTDFPVSELSIWFCDTVLMLPQEY